MKKLYLEFVRGAAAITVLLYHFLELRTLNNHSGHFYFANWGTDAVIVFFILSGIVINISQKNNPKKQGLFFVNRLTRIYPQFMIGLLLGIVVLYLTRSAIPSATVIAGNFLMLSSLKHYMVNIVPCIDSNSPVWSLSYEIVFYLLFDLSIGKHQKKMLFCWFAMSLAAMPLYYSNAGPDALRHFIAILSFSAIWLLGYFLYEYRNLFYTGKYTAAFSLGSLPLISRMHLSANYYDPAKYLLFAIFAIPFFRYCLQITANGKKINLYYIVLPFLPVVYVVFRQPYLTFSAFITYSVLPICLIILVLVIHAAHLKTWVTDAINSFGKIIGRLSYSIYIIHYPILFLCAYLFHNSLVNLLVSLVAVSMIAYLLENVFQPAAVTAIRKLKPLSRSTNEPVSV